MAYKNLYSTNFENVFNDTIIIKEFKTIYNQLNMSISKNLNSNILFNKTYDAITALDILNSIRIVIEKFLFEQVKAYSKYQWLWYIRRFPIEKFYTENNLSTTKPYDKNLAECVVKIAAKEGSCNFDEASYKIDRYVARHFIRFYCSVQILSQIHTYIRYSGKGAKFVFRDYIKIEIKLSETEINAINLYDRRMVNEENLLAKLGTYMPFDEIKRAKFYDFFLLVNYLTKEHYVEIEQGKNIKIEYYPSILTIAKLKQYLINFNNLKYNFNENLYLIICLLFVSHYLFFEMKINFDNILFTGYYCLKKDFFEKIIDKTFDNILINVKQEFNIKKLSFNKENFIEKLLLIKCSIFPITQGYPIFKEGNSYIIDMLAITQMLYSYLYCPKTIQGNIANYRAETFENSVAEIIKNSTWNPGENNLRKKIKKDGKEITDLDVVGIKDSTLLIISCKSRMYTDEYEIGDYNEIRNTKNLVNEAVDYWDKIKQFLIDNPVGDNYNYSSYNNIISVVCTPFPVYTDYNKAISTVENGLYKVCSITELANWIKNK